METDGHFRRDVEGELARDADELRHAFGGVLLRIDRLYGFLVDALDFLVELFGISLLDTS